ncbi:hypothetical protein FD33_GL000492 [Companilactobacillus paralimentarius DSM 13238 = JCM 10415]|uniref:Uncharacterized protein n=1 Tax=Companilactobacillus paralimentarius DSM 13238 = JCM 10415 TaxID=1122151 RepID=A0A0R1PBB5_9LACO|nr:hypothetical protein FD33_GL000492 [Companilactobacillus paralimentarius DSM 13238 = JCM 10415]
MLVALMNKKSSYQLIKEVMKNLDKMELEETVNIPVKIILKIVLKSSMGKIGSFFSFPVIIDRIEKVKFEK